MNLKDSMKSLEARLNKSENTAKKEAERPIGKHSNSKGIKMSNALISATHNLNLSERRMIYLAMSNLKQGNEVHLEAKEYAKTFGISETQAYEQLETACNKLFEREIQFTDGRKKGRARWVQSAIYHEGEGWCSIEFTDIVRANIKGLVSQYTRYNLEQAGNLKSVYSWRFLERFIQYGNEKKRNSGWWEVSINNLCEFLELSDYYQKFNQLNNKILIPSFKELDEKDGWKVEVKPIKTGRKITHIRFEFKQDPQSRIEF